MLPDEVYKRRPNHNNTPESITLIIANFIVFAVATQLFAGCKIGTFFWVIMGALAVYNFFNVRKYREDYQKPQIIAYVLSIIIMLAVFILMRVYATNC